MVRALLIDNAVRDRIREVIRYAEEHPICLQAIKEIVEGRMPPPGDVGFDMRIDMGFRVVFTVEEHPGGWCKHISISVDGNKDKVPHPAAVNMILEEFGMPEIERIEGTIWMEDCGNGTTAVNVVSRYHGFKE